MYYGTHLHMYPRTPTHVLVARTGSRRRIIGVHDWSGKDSITNRSGVPCGSRIQLGPHPDPTPLLLHPHRHAGRRRRRPYRRWRERECVLGSLIGSNRSRLDAAGGEAALAQPPGGSGREPESERRVQWRCCGQAGGAAQVPRRPREQLRFVVYAVFSGRARRRSRAAGPARLGHVGRSHQAGGGKRH